MRTVFTLLLLVGTCCAPALYAQSVITKGYDRTALWTQPGTVTAQCTTGPQCIGLAQMFTNTGALGFSCLQPVGTQCIYQIEIESDVVLAVQGQPSTGFFRFLVDGVAPKPGPTTPTGYLPLGVWESGWVETHLVAFSEVAVVTNTVTNQLHKIEIDIACTPFSYTGNPSSDCEASASAATARIDVFH